MKNKGKVAATAKSKKIRKSPKRRQQKSMIIAAVAALAAVTALFVVPLFSPEPEAVASIKVYKSPTCGCCAKWIDHLEDNGFAVDIVNRPDVSPIKRELGVPERLYSCHTAKVDGYVVEGHVPASDILQMLAEKPPVRGLAVPGMPQGSPGMETGRKDSYSVMTFDENKLVGVYNRH